MITSTVLQLIGIGNAQLEITWCVYALYFEFRFHSVFPRCHASLSRILHGSLIYSLEVKSSHVLWIAIFPADKQIMHLPSDHVSKIYSYHFPDTRTRSTIRSSDRAFTVDRLLRRERVHFVHTCYIVNSPTWTIISHSAERLCTEFQIVPSSPTKYRRVTDNPDHVDNFHAFSRLICIATLNSILAYVKFEIVENMNYNC